MEPRLPAQAEPEEPPAPRNPDERDPRPVDFVPPRVNLSGWDPTMPVFPPEQPQAISAPNHGERPLEDEAVQVTIAKGPDPRLELALAGIVVTFRGLTFEKPLGPNGEPAERTNVCQAYWNWGLDAAGEPKVHTLIENVDPYEFSGLPIAMKHAVQESLIQRFVAWRASILAGSPTDSGR